MKTKYLKNLAGAIVLATLASCGGIGSCPPISQVGNSTLTIASSWNPSPGGSCSIITATVPSAVNGDTVIHFTVTPTSTDYGFGTQGAATYPDSTTCTILSGQSSCSTSIDTANNLCAASSATMSTNLLIAGTANGYTAGSANTIIKNSYAYVANYGSEGVDKCVLNSDGTFGTCSTISMGVSTYYVAFETVNNIQYAYVGSSDGVNKCKLATDGSGDLIDCDGNANYSDTSVYKIVFATAGATRYAYLLPSQLASQIKKCPVDNAGNFGTCDNAIDDGSIEASGFTIAMAANGIQYGYLTDGTTAPAYQCEINASGIFGDGSDLATSCTDLTPIVGFDSYPWDITITTFGGIQYAYVSGWNGGSNDFYLNLLANNGIPSNGIVIPTTNPGWDYNGITSFAVIAGVTYAYVADETNVYLCPVNISNGQFTSCAMLSQPAEITSWSPYSVAFPTN